jgi:hypothetical protein
MFRLSHTLRKENLAHVGVMAVRLSPLLPFEPSGGLYWNLYIHSTIRNYPSVIQFNFLPSEIHVLARLLCHTISESDISGTRSAVFKCCVICLGKIMCFFQVIVIDCTTNNMAAMQNLHAGRPLIRFPMVSLEFFIDIILSAALWPSGRLSLWQKWVPGIFPVG